MLDQIEPSIQGKMLQHIASRIASLVESRDHERMSANREIFRYLLDIANELASREASALASLLTAICLAQSGCNTQRAILLICIDCFPDTDIVMPTPWRGAGFVSALTTIGHGETSGQRRQDSSHGVSLILPWHIGLVTGGNDSIAAGVLGHQAVLSPADVLGLTPLFDKVVCDGDHFIDRYSHEPLARVQGGRMAAQYEI